MSGRQADAVLDTALRHTDNVIRIGKKEFWAERATIKELRQLHGLGESLRGQQSFDPSSQELNERLERSIDRLVTILNSRLVNGHEPLTPEEVFEHCDFPFLIKLLVFLASGRVEESETQAQTAKRGKKQRKRKMS